MQQESQKQNLRTSRQIRDRQTDGQTDSRHRQVFFWNHRQKIKRKKHTQATLVTEGCRENATQWDTHTPWGPCALCHVGGCKTHCLESDGYSDCGDKTTTGCKTVIQRSTGDMWQEEAALRSEEEGRSHGQFTKHQNNNNNSFICPFHPSRLYFCLGFLLSLPVSYNHQHASFCGPELPPPAAPSRERARAEAGGVV